SATAALPVISARSGSSAARPSPPEAVAGSGRVMTQVVLISRIEWIDSGQAIVTSPAPVRSALFPARNAAPDMPGLPAITSTWPNVPLWLSAARVGKGKGAPANMRNRASGARFAVYRGPADRER